MTPKQTTLFSSHKELGAKMLDFAGWMMPIQYKNLKEEVLAVRESVGVFDVSHMGEFFITGPDTTRFVDQLVTNDIEGAEILKAIYSPLCREDGTIIDDLIVYKLADQEIMICVNAANISKDFDWIKSQLKEFDCKLEDRSNEFSLLALQGPKSFEMLKKLNLGFEVSDMSYYSIERTGQTLIARTGYTGEDGFEIFASHEKIKSLWAELMSLGVAPCGLGSRDVLRLEVCYPLYGHELNDEVTPLDSGLKWTVKAAKKHFIGKSALSTYTPKFQLIKIEMNKGIARDGYQVENKEGQTIGEITSGTMSVIRGKGIALARVNKELYQQDQEVIVDIRGKKYTGIVVKKPFVTGGHK